MKFSIYLTIFLIAFIPRVLALDAYVAPDEGKWIYRSAHFLQALLHGDLAQATSVAATPDVEVLAPAVPTMWAGALGLAAKYAAADTSPSTSLSDYLRTIPAKTEKIPLSFYPWARFPTALLTSLAMPLFYFLLLQLMPSPTALLATLLITLDPFFLGLSRVIHHDALVAIFINLSLLTLLLSRRRSSRLWLILSGIGGGLALSTKPTALYLVIFAGLFLAVENIARGAGRGARSILSRPQRSEGRIEGGASRFIPCNIRAFVIDGAIWLGVALLTFIVIWPALWVAPLETLHALFQRSASASTLR